MTDTFGLSYCYQCVKGEKTVGKYIKLQAQLYIDILEDHHPDAKFDDRRYGQLKKLLKLINMASGYNAGQPLINCLFPWQWWLLEAVFCIVNRDDPSKRYYENIILEIARKNSKSFISGLIMIILMLLEPKYSKLYSVSSTGALSRMVMTEMSELLKSSPALFDQDLVTNNRSWGGKFQITKNIIRCAINQNEYAPLNYSARNLDGRRVSTFLVDECGSLTDPYALQAMRSGQLTMKNKLGIVISTRYPGTDNVFEQELDYARKVLDGLIEAPKQFAMLYEPDQDIAANWQTDINVLLQSNPLAAEIPSIMDDILEKRQFAVEMESARSNFMLKHCNIFTNDIYIDKYVDIDDVKQCQVDKDTIDWTGRDVYVGLDLSLTNDNTSFVMLALDDDGETVLCKPFAYLPTDKVEEKTKHERLDYTRMINGGYCKACGDAIIDYTEIQKDILAIESKYKCNVIAIGTDPWHATQVCQALENEGLPVTLIKQHSYILGEPTTVLRDKILQRKFKFEKNPLYCINFENCRTMVDTNLNIYINKKRSVNKVDMVAATICGMYLLHQASLVNTDFGAMVI